MTLTFAATPSGVFRLERRSKALTRNRSFSFLSPSPFHQNSPFVHTGLHTTDGKREGLCPADTCIPIAAMCMHHIKMHKSKKKTCSHSLRLRLLQTFAFCQASIFDERTKDGVSAREDPLVARPHKQENNYSTCREWRAAAPKLGVWVAPRCRCLFLFRFMK